MIGRGFAGDDLDEQIWMGLDLLLLGDTLVTDLVDGVGRLQNQHAERDFLAGVEGVDDQAHELLDVGIKRRKSPTWFQKSCSDDEMR